MTEPTDKEIVAFAVENGMHVRTGRGAVKFARAVLAKWGAQPAVAGEPGEIAQQLEYLLLETENKQHPHMGAVAFLEACEAFILDHGADVLNLLSGGPTQPQAGAVPLTDEQAASLCKMGPVYAPDGQVVRTPEQYRRELEGAKLAGIRTAERAHGIGIKGGQHGAT